MKPTQQHIDGFLQGTQIMRDPVKEAILTAQRQKKSITEAVDRVFLEHGVNWKLRAETKGYKTHQEVMLDIQQVYFGCVIAFIAIAVLVYFTGGTNG